jgi:catechol 2,3-dioxygenase-like lactoylglutathione lyase family enzyme
VQHLSAIALVVPDYGEAIAFYVSTLGLDLIENTRLSDTKRWVLVAPPGSTETRLLLAKADGPEQKTRIGNRTGAEVGSESAFTD